MGKKHASQYANFGWLLLKFEYSLKLHLVKHEILPQMNFYYM